MSASRPLLLETGIDNRSVAVETLPDGAGLCLKVEGVCAHLDYPAVATLMRFLEDWMANFEHSGSKREATAYPPQSGGAGDAAEPSVISRLMVEVEHLAERQAESDIAVLSLAGTVAELAARLVKALS